MLNLFLINTLFSSSLGMSLVAMHFSLLNNPQLEIEEFIKTTFYDRYGIELDDQAANTYFSFLTSIFFAGSMVGTLCLGGYAANKYGRRKSLIYVQLAVICGTVIAGGSEFMNSYEMFLIGRALTGIGIGCITVIMPLYISEVLPISKRGVGGMFVTLALAFGATFVFVISQHALLGNDLYWPFLILLMIFPSLLFVLLMSMAPESPKYLILTLNKLHEGEFVLRKLRGGNEQEVANEIRAMEEERSHVQEGHESEPTTIWHILTSVKLRLPLFVCICVTMSQVMSGFPVMVIYSTKLFQLSGLGLIVSKHATLLWSTVNLFIPPFFGYLVERVGRRKLLLGSIIMSIFTTISITIVLSIAHKDGHDTSTRMNGTIAYYDDYEVTTTGICMVILSNILVVTYCLGIGALPYIVAQEIFTQGPRAQALALTQFVLSTSTFIVALLFPQLQNIFNGMAFFPLTCAEVLIFIVLFFYFPETRNEEPANLTLLFQIPNAWKTPIGLKWSKLLIDVKRKRSQVKCNTDLNNYGSCESLVVH